MTRQRIARLQRRVDEALDPFRGVQAELDAQRNIAARRVPPRAPQVRPPVVVARGIDALQNTDGRASDDFPGAVE